MNITHQTPSYNSTYILSNMQKEKDIALATSSNSELVQVNSSMQDTASSIQATPSRIASEMPELRPQIREGSGEIRDKKNHWGLLTMSGHTYGKNFGQLHQRNPRRRRNKWWRQSSDDSK